MHVSTRSNTTCYLVSLILSWTVVAGAQDALSRARQALDSGNTAEAITLLENYRSANPAQADVYNLLGIAYARTDDSDRSLAMFQEFARLQPDKPEAFNNLGAAYLRKGNGEQAETAFRHALGLNRQDVNALYNLGALLNARHKYSESRPLLDAAFRRERSPAIAYEAAVATAGSGDRARALHILASTNPPEGQNAVPWLKLAGTLNLDAGNLAAASSALEKAIALAPDDESIYALALVRLRRNQPDQALLLLDRTFSALPPSSRHIREGTLLAAQGAYKQAASLFERAAVEDPTSYDALYNLAVLRLEKTKDVDGAFNAAKQALALKTTGEIHDLIGDVYEAQGHYRDALNEYQEAVRLDPASDKFVFDLGAELILHENYDAAQKVFRAGEERFPRASRMYLGMGATEFLDGKTGESVDAFLKAIDLDPNFEPAYLFLGEAFSFSDNRSAEVVAKLAHWAGKRPQSFGAQYYYGAALVQQMQNEGNLETADIALAALRRAAALHPQDARVLYQLGEVFRLEKRLTQAIPYYEKSAALDANFPEPLYKLGQTYVRLGKQEDAKKMFARHRDVMTRAEAGLYHRSSEIQSFVLKMRSAQ